MKEANNIVMSSITTQTIKWVVGGVFGLVGVLGIRKYIKSKQTSAQVAKVSAAIEQTTSNTSDLTISEAQAVILANKLYGAMSGNGTDEKQILACLEGRTADDIRLIYKAFGVKPYGVTGKPTFSFYATDLDLTGWLRKELSGTTLKKVEAIFTNAGILF